MFFAVLMCFDHQLPAHNGYKIIINYSSIAGNIHKIKIC